MPRSASLRVTAGSLLVVATASACALGDARTCGPDGTGESADEVAGTFTAGEYVGGVRTDGAATFLYEPHPDRSLFADEAVYVLCVDHEVLSGGYTQTAPLLSDTPAGIGLRVGASVGVIDGAVEVEPGWVLGRVNDERVVELRLEWHGDDSDGDGAAGRWATTVTPGFFLVQLPPHVPQDANISMRFLDADGELIWSQPTGG